LHQTQTTCGQIIAANRQLSDLEKPKREKLEKPFEPGIAMSTEAQIFAPSKNTYGTYH
jgi:hypothetical protein